MLVINVLSEPPSFENVFVILTSGPLPSLHSFFSKSSKTSSLSLPPQLCPRKKTDKKMAKRKLKKRKAKKPTKEVSWSVLPSDVEEMILSRLPATSLMRFRCVSKHWCSLVTKPHFIKMQLHRSFRMYEGSKLVFACDGDVFSLDVQAYGKQYVKTRAQKGSQLRREEMVLPFRDQCCDKFLSVSGSCNGILLLSASDCLYLLNPATKEYKKLHYPEILAYKPSSSSIIDILGYGYRPGTDEYKVMMIRCYSNQHSAPSDVWVYTLGTNSSWRTIGRVRYKINRGFNQWQRALVNGALHWMADVGKESIVLISFDFGDEELRELPLPKSFSKQDTHMGLVKFSDFLSLYHFNANGDFVIWTMIDYGDEQSWAQALSIPQHMWFGGQPVRVAPIGFLNDDVVLFETGSCFFTIDLSNLEILLLKFPVSVYGSEMYSESLVSLGNDGGVGGSKQKRREKEGERSAEGAEGNKLVKCNKKQRG